jgi:hypothetical protein
MIYLKSFLAGLAALIILAALVIGVLIFGPLVMERSGAGWAVGAFAFPTLPVLAVALLTFAAVSYWTFKRLSKR